MEDGFVSNILHYIQIKRLSRNKPVAHEHFSQLNSIAADVNRGGNRQGQAALKLCQKLYLAQEADDIFFIARKAENQIIVDKQYVIELAIMDEQACRMDIDTGNMVWIVST